MTTPELRELRESVWRIMGWTPWKEEEYPHRNGWSLLDGEGEKRLECDMDDPITDPAAAMQVLKKCIENLNMTGNHLDFCGSNGGWYIQSDRFAHECYCSEKPEDSLELIICLFAQKLFKKS